MGVEFDNSQQTALKDLSMKKYNKSFPSSSNRTIRDVFEHGRKLFHEQFGRQPIQKPITASGGYPHVHGISLDDPFILDQQKRSYFGECCGMEERFIHRKSQWNSVKFRCEIELKEAVKRANKPFHNNYIAFEKEEWESQNDVIN